MINIIKFAPKLLFLMSIFAYFGILKLEVIFKSLLNVNGNESIVPPINYSLINNLFNFDFTFISALRFFLICVIISVTYSYFQDIKNPSSCTDILDKQLSKLMSKTNQIKLSDFWSLVFWSAAGACGLASGLGAFSAMVDFLLGNLSHDFQLNSTGESSHKYCFYNTVILLSVLLGMISFKFKIKRGTMNESIIAFGLLFPSFYVLFFFARSLGEMLVGESSILSFSDFMTLEFIGRIIGLYFLFIMSGILLVRFLCSINLSYKREIKPIEFEKSATKWKFKLPKREKVYLKDQVKLNKTDFLVPFMMPAILAPLLVLLSWSFSESVDVLNSATINHKEVVYRDNFQVHPDNTFFEESFIEFALGNAIIYTDDDDKLEHLYLAAKHEKSTENYIQSVAKAQLMNLRAMKAAHRNIMELDSDFTSMNLGQSIQYQMIRIKSYIIDYDRAILFTTMIVNKEYQKAADYIDKEFNTFTNLSDKAKEKTRAPKPFYGDYLLFMIDDIGLAEVNKNEVIDKYADEAKKLKGSKNKEKILSERAEDLNKIFSIFIHE